MANTPLQMNQPLLRGGGLSRGENTEDARDGENLAGALGMSSRVAQDKSQHEGTATSLALKRKLIILPARQDSKCTQNNRVTDCELLRFEDCMFAPQGCKCYGSLSS